MSPSAKAKLSPSLTPTVLLLEFAIPSAFITPVLPPTSALETVTASLAIQVISAASSASMSIMLPLTSIGLETVTVKLSTYTVEALFGRK